ncbi:uncharacterized protein LY89DRAFT_740317 [Mollisia scopiformis]|uniref:Uncharacterized protein n=1 Tax=Mollisia scopiformis TaxID=149040 RepID=A0A132BBZ4_MOLSC|nr:uncharacterized protein LY89DRAFT_740317 [Mollisia scopiformis]KUJ09898.1 hypothetical protein LY89DRAFT_740317 [Mollisia scopiformis]
MKLSSVLVGASALLISPTASSPITTSIENLLQLRTKLTTFKISASSPVLPAHPHFLISDDSSTSPNQYGILVHDYYPQNVPSSGLWTLTSSHHPTDYKTRYAQQDPGQTSEWIWVDTAANIEKNDWVYVDFFVDDDTLEMKAKKEDNGNHVLQICEIALDVYYLDLSKVKGTTETTSDAKCFPVVLTAVPV